MAKIKIGDIFSINTPKGKAYLHYVYVDNDGIELIRVLPGLYLNDVQDITLLSQQKELFMLFFPLRIAFHRKIVKLEGHTDIGSFKKPQYMREDDYIRGNFSSWYIVNIDTCKRKYVKKLSPKQNALSPWGVWNDTLLIERLVEGWTLDKWTESVEKDKLMPNANQ